MNRKAIVCDIDGVLLNPQFIIDEIHKLGLKGDEKWEYFYKHCNSDRVEVIEEMLNLLRVFERDGYLPIILTARNDKCYFETDLKLCNCGVFAYKMYMRSYCDLRPACEVKREHLIEIMKEFDVITFIDDDIDNCKMAKDLGILVLRRV